MGKTARVLAAAMQFTCCEGREGPGKEDVPIRVTECGWKGGGEGSKSAMYAYTHLARRFVRVHVRGIPYSRKGFAWIMHADGHRS